MKQSAWFSLVALIHKHDESWHCHKHMAELVAHHFLKTKGNKNLLEYLKASTLASGTDGECEQSRTKEEHLDEMRRLRRRAGNSMLLAPMMMTDHNLVNARILLLVGVVVDED